SYGRACHIRPATYATTSTTASMAPFIVVRRLCSRRRRRSLPWSGRHRAPLGLVRSLLEYASDEDRPLIEEVHRNGHGEERVGVLTRRDDGSHGDNDDDR